MDTNNLKIICLAGIDGSGKSTHLRRLEKELTDFGLRCKCVWARSAFFFSLPFMMLCRVLGLTEVVSTSSGTKNSIHRYYMCKPVSLVWPWISLVDNLIFAVVHAYLPISMGYTVLLDRSCYDNFVDIMVDTQRFTLDKSFLGLLFKKIVPRSCRVILLDVDENIAFIRKADTPGLEYLCIRRRIYKALAGVFGTRCITTNGEFEDVHLRILDCLKSDSIELKRTKSFR